MLLSLHGRLPWQLTVSSPCKRFPPLFSAFSQRARFCKFLFLPGIYLEDSQVISALKLLTHTFATVSLKPVSSAPTQTPLATGQLGAVCWLRAFWLLLLCCPRQPKGLFPISVPCRPPASPKLTVHPPGVHSPGSISVGAWPPQTAGLITCVSRLTGLPQSAVAASVGSGSQLPLSAVTASVGSGSRGSPNAVTASVGSGSQLPLSTVTDSVGLGSHPSLKALRLLPSPSALLS